MTRLGHGWLRQQQVQPHGCLSSQIQKTTAPQRYVLQNCDVCKHERFSWDRQNGIHTPLTAERGAGVGEPGARLLLELGPRACIGRGGANGRVPQWQGAPGARLPVELGPLACIGRGRATGRVLRQLNEHGGLRKPQFGGRGSADTAAPIDKSTLQRYALALYESTTNTNTQSLIATLLLLFCDLYA